MNDSVIFGRRSKTHPADTGRELRGERICPRADAKWALLLALLLAGYPVPGEAQPYTPPPVGAYAEGMIRADEPVRLVLLDSLRSGTSAKGESVRFRVDQEVRDRSGNLLMKEGADASGTVLTSRRAGAKGRRAELEVAIDYAVAVDGQHVALRARKKKAGDGERDDVAAEAILSAWPLLSPKESNITIRKGTKGMAYVDENVTVRLEEGR